MLTCRSVLPLKILHCKKKKGDTKKIHNCVTENLQKGHHSVTGQIFDNKIDSIIYNWETIEPFSLKWQDTVSAVYEVP